MTHGFGRGFDERIADVVRGGMIHPPNRGPLTPDAEILPLARLGVPMIIYALETLGFVTIGSGSHGSRRNLGGGRVEVFMPRLYAVALHLALSSLAIDSPLSYSVIRAPFPPRGLPERRYFNSGVILVDMNRWRGMRVGLRALDAAWRVGENLALHDQDALNVALAGDWIALDRSRWIGDGMPGWSSETLITGPPPSSISCRHRSPGTGTAADPFTDRFFHYLDLTGFAGWRPWNPLGIRSTLVRVHRSVPFPPTVMRMIQDRVRRGLTRRA